MDELLGERRLSLEAQNFDFVCLCWLLLVCCFLLMMSLFICCSHVVALFVVLVGRASAICCYIYIYQKKQSKHIKRQCQGEQRAASTK